ncbi:hypothetical protein F4810DRAFT_88418 [Camillea tinctor]|nr:hypothetical protein F4810DRAFT_88418 [Camillea tinctor]
MLPGLVLTLFALCAAAVPAPAHHSKHHHHHPHHHHHHPHHHRHRHHHHHHSALKGFLRFLSGLWPLPTLVGHSYFTYPTNPYPANSIPVDNDTLPIHLEPVADGSPFLGPSPVPLPNATSNFTITTTVTHPTNTAALTHPVNTSIPAHVVPNTKPNRWGISCKYPGSQCAYVGTKWLRVRCSEAPERDGTGPLRLQVDKVAPCRRRQVCSATRLGQAEWTKVEAYCVTPDSDSETAGGEWEKSGSSEWDEDDRDENEDRLDDEDLYLRKDSQEDVQGGANAKDEKKLEQEQDDIEADLRNYMDEEEEGADRMNDKGEDDEKETIVDRTDKDEDGKQGTTVDLSDEDEEASVSAESGDEEGSESAESDDEAEAEEASESDDEAEAEEASESDDEAEAEEASESAETGDEAEAEEASESAETGDEVEDDEDNHDFEFAGENTNGPVIEYDDDAPDE